MIRKFQCKSNDNYIKVDTEEGLIMIGCDDAPEYGESVLGVDELMDILFECGYSFE